MPWLRKLARRLGLLFRREAVERAMDAELRYHIEREVADRVRSGMPADEARRTALVDFGGIEAIKEDARDARGVRALEDLALDLRYAVRVLARNRTFTITAGEAGYHTFRIPSVIATFARLTLEWLTEGKDRIAIPAR